MSDRIVINASPLIALGKMGLFDMLGQLPFVLVTPAQVKQELDAGIRVGHSIDVPNWVEVRGLSSPLDPNLFDRLDSGEAAVIQLALEIDIHTVCLDETKGRRIAKELGLSVTGSLGILGKTKELGIISEVKSFIVAAIENGIYYDNRLVDRFFRELGE